MKLILSFILICIFIVPNYGQSNKLKQFDRKKWKELVNEVNKKRFDPREKNRESQSSTENEYNNLESDEYNGSGNESNDVNGEDGIYSDKSSTDDEIFFDKSNDKNGNGSGTNSENGDDIGDIDPRYDDTDENGNSSGNGNQKGGKYDSYKDKNGKDVYYTKEKPNFDRTTSSSGGSASGSGDSTWLFIIMIVILAIAVVYMVLVSFSEKNKKVVAVTSDENKYENLTISKSELELALEAALKNKNYREAVRIYFIAVIKEMKDRSWIKWEKKKTNYNYINEINGRQQQPDFITATRAFEIVWYGNRTLAENEYNQIEPLFKKLLKSIHS